MNNNIPEGTVHKLPSDLRQALMKNENVLKAWKDITPLARNEWICWTITNKKIETRKEHITRTVRQLTDGKRRPCCWASCIHRVKNSK